MVSYTGQEIDIQCRKVSKKRWADFVTSFPECTFKDSDNVHIVFVYLKTSCSMTTWSTEMAEARTSSQEKLIKLMLNIEDQFSNDRGIIALDPTCGLPLKEHGSSAFVEADDRWTEFGVEIMELGCCRCVNHPKFGSHCVLGVLFFDNPITDDELYSLIDAQ